MIDMYERLMLYGTRKEIMTYKDRIDVFATKEMTPLHVELYERFFGLHPDDAEKEELLKEQIYQD